MSFKYQISKGNEHRIFSEGGVKNLGDGTLESDHELSSPYLTLIQDQPAATPSAAPAQSAAAPQAAPQATPQTNEQSPGKEAAK